MITVLKEEGYYMLKFLGWVFSINKRHRQGIEIYEKSLLGKLWVLFLSLVLVGACFGTSYWFYSFISGIDASTNYPFLSVLGIGLLSVVALITSFDYSLSFTYVAFRNAFLGFISSAVDKDSAPITESAKNYKWLDILICVLEILILVATVASPFIIFHTYIFG